MVKMNLESIPTVSEVQLNKKKVLLFQSEDGLNIIFCTYLSVPTRNSLRFFGPL